MREIIMLQFGKHGNQVGNQVWSDMLDEEVVQTWDGGRQHYPPIDVGQPDVYFNRCNIQGEEVRLPRAVLVDAYPETAHDWNNLNIHRGMNILQDSHLYSGEDDADSDYYSEGFFTRKVENLIRRQQEKCNSIQGYQVVQSMEGFSASRFSSMALQYIKEDNPKNTIITHTLQPDQHMIDREPLMISNTLMAIPPLMDYADLVNFYDHRSTYEVSSTITSTTSCFRLESLRNRNMNQLANEMVPIPMFHFVAPSTTIIFQKENLVRNMNILVDDMMHPRNAMEISPIRRGTVTAAGLFLRGYRGLPQDAMIQNMVLGIKHRILQRTDTRLMDVPDVMTAICPVQRSLSDSTIATNYLCNTTGMSDWFGWITTKYRLLNRRLPRHWLRMFGLSDEDSEEALFTTEELSANYNDYEQDRNQPPADDEDV